MIARKHWKHFVLVPALALCGAALASYVLTQRSGAEAQVETPKPAEKPTTPKPPDGGIALEYAVAYRDGNCDEIIRLTSWMSDRLRRVAIESSDPAKLQKEREELCAKILQRPYEDNILRAEGIDDRFVFPAGCTIEVESKDAGRSDLGSPVRERTWLRVTYPRRETAPLAPADEDESALKPVRAWTVGVNIARDKDAVLKAAVRGNLEIKPGSASFDWPETN